MKIESGRGVSSSSSTRKGGGTGAAGFSVSESDGEAPRAASVSSAGAVTTLDAILALQGENPAGERRQRQLRRGKAALDALSSLEKALITGLQPAGLKAELEGLQRGAELTGEPDLDAVLVEIDIRVAVELAKLDMSGRA